MEETFAEMIKKNRDIITNEVEKEKLEEAYLCINCLCNKIKSLEETIKYLCTQNRNLEKTVKYVHRLLDNDLR